MLLDAGVCVRMAVFYQVMCGDGECGRREKAVRAVGVWGFVVGGAEECWEVFWFGFKAAEVKGALVLSGRWRVEVMRAVLVVL